LEIHKEGETTNLTIQQDEYNNNYFCIDQIEYLQLLATIINIQCYLFFRVLSNILLK